MTSPRKSAARMAAAISHPRNAGLGTAMAPRRAGSGGGPPAAVGNGGGGMGGDAARFGNRRQLAGPAVPNGRSGERTLAACWLPHAAATNFGHCRAGAGARS